MVWDRATDRQTSGDALALNYGTLYPALLKLEQEGAIAPSGRFPEQPAREVLRTARAERKNWKKKRRKAGADDGDRGEGS